MPAAPCVDIVLSVHNGAAYLQEFLTSLESQSYQHWRLVVRDNCSTDGTANVLDRWGHAHASQFVPVHDRLGFFPRAAASFNAALSAAAAPYVMFADADDVWLSQKIEHSLALLLRAERDAASVPPLLVHTDLEPTDARGRSLASSFWAYTACRPTANRCRFERLLVRNQVTGCTIIMNRKLLTLGWPVPAQAAWHDWWYALVAAAFGEIHTLEEATLRYRQHGSNETGAQPWGLDYWRRRLGGGLAGLRQTIALARNQAGAFQDRFATTLTAEHAHHLAQFVRLQQMGPWGRRCAAARLRLASAGWLRTSAWYLLM